MAHEVARAGTKGGGAGAPELCALRMCMPEKAQTYGWTPRGVRASRPRERGCMEVWGGVGACVHAERWAVGRRLRAARETRPDAGAWLTAGSTASAQRR